MDIKEVKNKIIFYCNKYNIEIPDFSNYDEVKIAADKINSICPFCGREKNGGGSVICICEINTY